MARSAGLNPRKAGPRCGDLAALDAAIVDCRACPRLVRWREGVARDRRAAYLDQEYWGRPVPGFGSTRPRLLIVGLAPAAHGANRTGRVFTGDRSGDWLFASLHRIGLANQAESSSVADGLSLTGARVTAAVRCAPPDNKPTTAERDRCAPWLEREIELADPVVFVALGGFAWQAVLRTLAEMGQAVPRPRPKFGHGEVVALPDGRWLVGCYHPSQQNTFTGRLTEPMLDEVLARARDLAGGRVAP